MSLFYLGQTEWHYGVLFSLINYQGRIERGGAGDQKNHKNVGFLTNTGPDPLKNYKVARPVLARGGRDSRAN